VAVAAQAGVLLFMAGGREAILRSGPRVWLRTAPVDPRDLFRGDYVRLNYQVSSPPTTLRGAALTARLDALRREGSGRHRSRELTVYTALGATPGGTAEAVGIDLTPPPAGLFLKGRLPVLVDGLGKVTTGPVQYGIDAYYVQEGTGRALEAQAPPGAPSDIQVPLEMEAALGRDGTAVLTGHRWAGLGLGVAVRPAPGAPSPPVEGQPPPGKVLTVTLFNTSPAPLAAAWPEDLTAVLHWEEVRWEEGGDPLSAPDPAVVRRWTAADYRILPAGGSLTATLDPRQPRWHVRAQGDAAAHPLGSGEEEWRSYRLVYRTPPSGTAESLNLAAEAWSGRLASVPMGEHGLR
jgi:uncharacterized membrane-anchored protein